MLPPGDGERCLLGANAGIGFDFNDLMGQSSCVKCGECMVSCPTGALTNKIVNQTAIAVTPDSQPVSLQELSDLPFFEGVSGTFLSLNRNAVVRRHFKRGEIICREGEYGSTAFYILEGEARVSIASPIAHVKTQGVMKRRKRDWMQWADDEERKKQQRGS